ncbi:MAG: hypothetical protein ACKOB4_18045 [Acidobacteriota bacterium]
MKSGTVTISGEMLVITNLRNGASGRYLAISQAPNYFGTSFDLRGLEISQGFNGKSGWIRDSRDGLRTLTGQASREFQVEAAWRASRWLNYKKDRAKLTPPTRGEVDGRTVNVIQLTTARNIQIRLFFDAESGRLIREELPLDGVTRRFDYGDFRMVNGLLEPHLITMTLGDERYEIRLEKILHNPTVDRSLFDFPIVSNEPLPDIDALLREVGKNEERIDEILDKYTYTESIVRREINDQGQAIEKESNTYELTFFKGNRIRRLVARNGRPLSPGDEADETRKVEKRIREIEKREAEKERKAIKECDVDQSATGSPDAERGQRISIADVLRASKLINPRRERYRNHEVIVFDFEPLPGYKPRKDYEKFFGKTVGAIWVDPHDKQVARVDARLVQSYKVAGGLLASLREGATFVLEQERINNEIWLPTRIDINLGLRVLLVKGISVNQTITFGNYRRFNVDADRERLENPPIPPQE